MVLSFLLRTFQFGAVVPWLSLPNSDMVDPAVYLLNYFQFSSHAFAFERAVPTCLRNET